MKTNFETQIPRNKAIKIADSQYDLCQKSKEDMVIALAGDKGCKKWDELLSKRKEAFERLDVITQFIVNQILYSAITEEDGISSHLEYVVKNIDAAKRAV